MRKVQMNEENNLYQKKAQAHIYANRLYLLPPVYNFYVRWFCVGQIWTTLLKKYNLLLTEEMVDDDIKDYGIIFNTQAHTRRKTERKEQKKTINHPKKLKMAKTNTEKFITW